MPLTFPYVSIVVCFLIEHPRTLSHRSASFARETAIFPNMGFLVRGLNVTQIIPCVLFISCNNFFRYLWRSLCVISTLHKSSLSCVYFFLFFFLLSVGRDIFHSGMVEVYLTNTLIRPLFLPASRLFLRSRLTNKPGTEIHKNNTKDRESG